MGAFTDAQCAARLNRGVRVHLPGIEEWPRKSCGTSVTHIRVRGFTPAGAESWGGRSATRLPQDHLDVLDMESVEKTAILTLLILGAAPLNPRVMQYACRSRLAPWGEQEGRHDPSPAVIREVRPATTSR